MLTNLFLGQTAEEKNFIEDLFSCYLYTGNGSTQTITNGIDLAGKGGMVWLKDRSNAADHVVQDTVRGNTKILNTNSTAAEDTASAGTNVTSFNSTGFSLGTNYSNINTNGQTYASWTFRKAPKFFDVVTWSGNSTNRTISHSLGSVPGMIIVKRTDSAADWQVYHRSLANTEYAVLNTTAAKATGTTRWNSTTATDTVFSLGTDSTVNATGGSYVAYLFAHNAGGFGADGSQNVISCGSFTSNNTVQSITLGYEPQFVIVKSSNYANDWWVFDNMRGMSQTSDKYLVANTTAAEATFSTLIRPTATGFTWDGPYAGDNGTSYIYMAIRRGPMRTPTSGTSVFKPVLATSSGTFTASTGFPVDLDYYGARSSTDKWFWFDRLRGNPYLISNTTAAEVASVGAFDSNTSFYLSGVSGDYSDYINYAFARAPGFFDTVCYTGTGSSRTVSHNLGVAPELMIVKRRDVAGENWIVYSSSVWGLYSGYDLLWLNSSAAAGVNNNHLNSTQPTSSVFSLGARTAVNDSGGTYVAYLFATCAGVSKVGSYTGTGTTKQIDCGFTNGARFVLIKRTDSTGDWTVWDTARGIVSANDPYLLLNSTAAEVTNTDYIDPLSTGFEISSTAPAAINANGGTFVFLAIA